MKLMDPKFNNNNKNIIITIIIIIIIIITTKPRTVITTVNKNHIYFTYPMFIYIFLNKLSEDTASIFKFTPLTLRRKNDCKIF